MARGHNCGSIDAGNRGGIITEHTRSTRRWTEAVLEPSSARQLSCSASLGWMRSPRAEEVVGGSLRLGLDRPDSDEPVGPNDFWSRYAMGLERLGERLLEDPRVRGVGYAGSLPGTYHPWRRVEVEGLAPTTRAGELLGTGTARVDVDYFGVLDAELIAGRGFARSDLSGGANVVVVNESFVEDILGGRNAIGRRIRFPAEDSVCHAASVDGTQIGAQVALGLQPEPAGGILEGTPHQRPAQRQEANGQHDLADDQE